MPNWVYNTIEIKGNQTDIEKLFNTITNGKAVIDFAKIILVPECIQKCPPFSGSAAETACKFVEECNEKQVNPLVLLESEELPDYVLLEKESWEKRQHSFLTKTKKENLDDELNESLVKTYSINFKDLFKNYITCINETGCVDWYTWNIEHWGCKWDANCSRREGNSLYFETPWSAPYPIFIELAKQNPNVTLKVSIAHECDYDIDVYEYKFNKKKNKVEENFIETIIEEWEESEE